MPDSVSVPALMVSPPVPPIAPAKVPPAFDKVRVLPPSVTTPVFAPASDTIETPPLAPEISKVPFAVTDELAMLPVRVRFAPLWIVVVPL